MDNAGKITKEDAISRQEVLDGLASIAKAKAKSDAQKSLMGRVMFFVEQLPSVNPQPCEDVIRRQDVLDLAKKGVLVSNGNYESVCKAINEIPSVNPTKTGHWIWCVGSHKCSNCEEYTCFSHKELLKYCPNCGARMIEPQERSDKE